MSVNVVKVLEDLCEASDDVIYYGLRSCGDDEKNSQTKFNLVWDKSVETFQDMADEITELREFLAKVATCEIETFSFEVGDSGDTDCIEYVCTDIVEEANELLAKNK